MLALYLGFTSLNDLKDGTAELSSGGIVFIWLKADN